MSSAILPPLRFTSQVKTTDDEEKIDDISIRQWLSEIGLEQYVETLATNLSHDGHIISRRRLSTVRLQDFSSMGITRYDHQRLLMAHTNLALQYPFNSTQRHREVSHAHTKAAAQASLSSTTTTKLHTNDHGGVTIGLSGNSSVESPKKDISVRLHFRSPEKISRVNQNGKYVPEPGLLRPLNSARSVEKLRASASGKLMPPTSARGTTGNVPLLAINHVSNNVQTAGGPTSAREKRLEKRRVARRRRSFDESAWASINAMRQSSAESLGTAASAAQSLREGKVPTAIVEANNAAHTRRRWTYDNQRTAALAAAAATASGSTARGRAYGNMALAYDRTLASLRALNSEFINRFRIAVRAERASLLFIHPGTGDLVVLTEETGSWYRLPANGCLAGVCSKTGETLNIPDAYLDHRFNRNLDVRTGFRTKSVLCVPIRQQRGGGEVVAVLEMMNKQPSTDESGIPQIGFTQSDVDVLESGVQRVADVITDRFQDLLSCAENFAAASTYVGSKSGSVLDTLRGPSYAIPTLSARKKVD